MAVLLFQWSGNDWKLLFLNGLFLICCTVGLEMNENYWFLKELFLISCTACFCHLFHTLGGYVKVLAWSYEWCIYGMKWVKVTTDWPVLYMGGDWKGLSCHWLPYTCVLRVLSFSGCNLLALVLSLCTMGWLVWSPWAIVLTWGEMSGSRQWSSVQLHGPD